MKTTYVSIAVLAAVAAVAPALAFTCADEAIAVGPVYIDARHVVDDEYLYSVWFFAESGVAPGLQRGGSHAVLTAAGQEDLANQLGETDPDCAASAESDLILF